MDSSKRPSKMNTYNIRKHSRSDSNSLSLVADNRKQGQTRQHSYGHHRYNEDSNLWGFLVNSLVFYAAVAFAVGLAWEFMRCYQIEVAKKAAKAMLVSYETMLNFFVYSIVGLIMSKKSVI